MWPNDPSSPTPPNTVPDCQPKADGGVRCGAWLGDLESNPQYQQAVKTAETTNYRLRRLLQ